MFVGDAASAWTVTLIRHGLPFSLSLFSKYTVFEGEEMLIERDDSGPLPRRDWDPRTGEESMMGRVIGSGDELALITATATEKGLRNGYTAGQGHVL